MNYLAISINVVESGFTEILEAELSEMPFESFEIIENYLHCYIQEQDFQEEQLNGITSAYTDAIVSATINKVEHQNWNAVWESNYDAVAMNNELFIGASFHKNPSGFNHYITLEPNMSFGTGHHPTTAQVLIHMFDMDLAGKKILDFGCGSGVLSIYAAFKNGNGIGVEIDDHAAEAARHNLRINNIDSFEIVTGGIDSIKGQSFNHILANINKNVIEECLETFKNCLLLDGQLICSGFLVSDILPLSEKLIAQGFVILNQKSQNDWAVIVAKRVK